MVKVTSALIIMLVLGISSACAWGLKTEHKMVLCDSREAAEQLKAAHTKAFLAMNWPQKLDIKGCRFLKVGVRIQPHGEHAHDANDHEILMVELPNSCEDGWTTDWVYQTRTDSNPDEGIPLTNCQYRY